jgi:hypothetical protein
MSDAEAVTLESSAPPEVQQRAESMGWIPPTRYKGEPERFIDAEAYIERGETVLPIVKQQNAKLKAELDAVRAQSQAQADALAKAQAAIEQIEERHSVATQKAVERAKEEVKMQLAAASEAGDHEGVAALTDKLVELRTAEKAPVEKPVAKPTEPAPFTPPADLTEWIQENQWFQTDRKRTALALAVAQELREGGDVSTGRNFYDKVAREVNKLFEPSAPATSKVEGARNGEDASAGSSKKGYASLPADAKAACDADTRKFVGPNKKYKTEGEWRNRFAELYFSA